MRTPTRALVANISIWLVLYFSVQICRHLECPFLTTLVHLLISLMMIGIYNVPLQNPLHRLFVKRSLPADPHRVVTSYNPPSLSQNIPDRQVIPGEVKGDCLCTVRLQVDPSVTAKDFGLRETGIRIRQRGAGGTTTHWLSSVRRETDV